MGSEEINLVSSSNAPAAIIHGTNCPVGEETMILVASSPVEDGGLNEVIAPRFWNHVAH
jgi:hypothetical protein